mmetsp:Transcript_20496/g.68812  ORF Transcript_20496/g.68812 Transcript_20496/m.68812 type:complete len:226 (+) Transcript_20496:122-799(+)
MIATLTFEGRHHASENSGGPRSQRSWCTAAHAEGRARAIHKPTIQRGEGDLEGELEPLALGRAPALVGQGEAMAHGEEARALAGRRGRRVRSAHSPSGQTDGGGPAGVGSTGHDPVALLRRVAGDDDHERALEARCGPEGLKQRGEGQRALQGEPRRAVSPHLVLTSRAPSSCVCGELSTANTRAASAWMITTANQHQRRNAHARRIRAPHSRQRLPARARADQR